MGIFKKSKIVDETIYGGTTADAFRVFAKTHWHVKMRLLIQVLLL